MQCSNKQVCLHPGERLQIAGNVRVYPYAADLYQLRTSEEMKNHAHLAQESGTDVSEKCKLIIVDCACCNAVSFDNSMKIIRFMVLKDCRLCITI